MKRLLYYTLLLCAALFASCEEEGFKTFEGEVSGIYLQRDGTYEMDLEFGGKLNQQYVDSISLSFASTSASVTQTTVYVPVKTIGNVTDYDRPFIFRVNEELTNAQKGVHYDYDESTCVIKANTAATNIPVTIHRTSDLLTTSRHIVFELEPNEYFTTELSQYKSHSSWQVVSDTLCGTRFKVIFSEIYNRPSYWDFAEATLGAWSVTKEQRINSLMGWSHRDWEQGGTSTSGVQYGRMSYAAKLLRKDLQAAADAGNPVLDEDGSYMQLAPGYEVDYSAYE